MGGMRTIWKGYPRLAPLVAGMAIAATSALALLLLREGTLEDLLKDSLRLTGRVSFVWFLAAFVAAPLAERGLPPGRTLLRHRRSLGLAFAGSHVVHAVMIATLVASVAGTSFPVPVLVFGGLGFGVIAALAVTSFPAPRRRLGAARWRALHTAGVWYVSLVYAYDFLLKPGLQGDLAQPRYAVFAALLLAAYGLRLSRARAGARAPRASGARLT